jgi:hypothetical protein
VSIDRAVDYEDRRRLTNGHRVGEHDKGAR